MSVLSTLTTFAAEAAHAAEEPAGIAALGIDPLAILAQAGTFLILFWVVKKFALNKIVKTLEERRQTIDNGVRLGRKMEAEEAKLEDKIEESLRRTRAEADKIIAGAQAEGGEIVRAAEDRATAKADQLMQEARGRIDEEMQKARAELQKDMLALVSAATEAIIEEKLDDRKDESLIRRALNSVGVRQ